MAVTLEEYVGSELIRDVAVVDTAGDATNPAAAVVTLTDPDGETTTAPAGTYTFGTDAEVTNPSTGTIRFTATTAFAAAQVGLWEFKVEITNGAREQVSVEIFRVVGVA